LAREVYHLVAEGVVSVTDVDTALCWGPGLRWGVMGQVLLNHLGGGEGGIEATLHRFRPILLTAAAAILGMIPIAPRLRSSPNLRTHRRGILKQ
jgi:hypothetical protein